ncbi:MAG: PaaI family thioesterase [Pseudomonadota bacterium]
MSDAGFGTDQAMALLAEMFAPFVARMGLRADALGREEARFSLPENPDLALRGGPGAGVICGQALAAIADSVSVLALAGANGRFRNCTTTDMAISYLRPAKGALRIEVAIPRNGRQLASCQVTIWSEGHAKPAVLATATFMYLEA